MKKAIWYKTDGTQEEVTPANGTDFNLKELQDRCGSTIDIQRLAGSEDIMVLDDNGKLNGSEKNEKGTEIWKKAYPIAEYPNNNDELIVGNVIVCHNSMVK